ncbi:hypothetical protein [Rothia nasimurium]|uniref:hypothetical protein n=1 Tax=Rothia nasimurium TaxID=85336 RepID=UPI002DD66341|nr:hypothetical protein [Rothia nasimurium]
MAVEFTPNASKHRIPHQDALYAVLHHEVAVDIPGRDGFKAATLYIGHPHGQTDRYIEVIAEVIPPRGFKIFYVMPLSPKNRKYL